jgi:hypothetical protein
MTGLVERLRKTEGGVLAEPYINPDGPEAADRIKALEAQLIKADKLIEALIKQLSNEIHSALEARSVR